ncbi:Nucleoporin NUP188-like protein [Elsinoe fawcettii]|nr:Nucleoporin NUP188-like protein [Elsinoe fawcettii]
MASTPSGSYYLPALDDVLHRRQAIISWRTLYLALAEPLAIRQISSVDKVLKDQRIRELLIDPFSAHQKPSSTSRTQYDNLTSAINAPGSGSRNFDVKELKEDASWLSKELDVDEVTALRVVLLEWQDRARRDLLSHWTEDEVIGLRNTTASSSSGTLSNLLRRCEITKPGSKSSADKDRSRNELLALFYTEEQYLWKTSEIVFGLAQRAELQPSASTLSKPCLPPSLRMTAQSIWKSHAERYAVSGDETVVAHSARALRGFLDHLVQQETWPTFLQNKKAIASIFVSSSMETIISLLRILQLHLHRETYGVTSASDISLWFGGLHECLSFSMLENFGRQQFDIIASLLVYTSIELLKAAPTLDLLYAKVNSSNATLYPKMTGKAYIEEPASLRIVTEYLLSTIEDGITWIGPICLVWAVLARDLRMLQQELLEEERVQLPDGREDHSDRSSRRSSLKGTSSRALTLNNHLKAITDTIPRTEEGDDAISILANYAFKVARAIEVSDQMSNNLSNVFRLPTDAHTTICSKITAFETLRQAVTVAAMKAALADSVTEILSYTRSVSPTHTGQEAALWPSEPARSLNEDKEVMGSLMAQVVARYPYEIGAFATCLQAAGRSEAYVDADGSKIALLLESLDSFTCEIPIDWPFSPADDADQVVLQEDLPIFRLQRGVPSTYSNGLFHIPAGTEGLLLAERGSHAVVRWYFRHSALEYIGALLASRTEQARIALAIGPSDLDIQVETDLIALISTTLRGALATSDTDAARSLLGRVSDGMSRNDDIIAVISQTFEYHLQRHAVSVGDDSSIALLVQCIEFMKITLHVFPERIWTLLARSALLPINDNSGALVSIVGSTEIPMARFKFLNACVTLYDGLVADCVRRAASQHSPNISRAVTRFEDTKPNIAQTPQKMTNTLLLAFSRVLVEVLQSQTNWRFDDATERNSLVASIMRTSKDILGLAYGAAGGRSLLSVLEPAASHLVTSYISDADGNPPLLSLSDTFVTALAELGLTSEPRNDHELVSATAESLSFCTAVLKVGLAQEMSGVALRKRLFQALPVLARLFAVHDVFRPLVAELLTVLVRYANTASQDPPSLLGHLSAEATKSFLAIVTDTDSPLQDLEAEASIWDLLSAIVSNKQQWLAISLLTGSTPRERLKAGNDSKVTNKSLIESALDGLTVLESLPPRRALAMLAFVSHAQSHWEWISSTIAAHDGFISSITDWSAKLTPNSRQTDTEACIRNANENAMASFIAEILARYIHNIKDGSEQEKVKQLIPKLSYLRDSTTQVDGYNHSLHKNLSKNFEQKFPGLALDSFKRANLNPADLGRDYYYDLELAEKVLGSTPSWRSTKGQGFVDEVARANVNFALVDSQIALLKSWKSLALQSLKVAGSDAQLQRDMSQVASGCLRANIDSTIPTQLFENISEIRADFAFAILQQLNRVRSQDPGVKKLFALTWEAIRTTGLDFEVITDAKDASYYRTLLQILFLSVQPHMQAVDPNAPKTSKQSLTKSASTNPLPLTPLTGSFLEVINKVIAVNFRALCTLVHSSTSDNSTLAQPSDFVLLTALLQSLFRVPSTLTVHRQIAGIVADTSLIRYATSLYSWSDTLTPSDPGTYGEIATLFLLSLSTIPQVAELIATDSVLSSLSQANISSHLRATRPSKASGCGPFDFPSRLHGIWSRGILPLLLNIISAVGPGIAPEISGFLNSFPAQLRRCEEEILAPLQPSVRDPYRGCITLNLAAEAHSLALIGSVIEGLRQQGAAIGVDAGEIQEVAFDRKKVGEAVAGLLRNRRGLGERIVAIGEREEGLRRRRQGEGDMLEEKVVGELQGVVDAAGAI